jgi:hypothetical protein
MAQLQELATESAAVANDAAKWRTLVEQLETLAGLGGATPAQIAAIVELAVISQHKLAAIGNEVARAARPKSGQKSAYTRRPLPEEYI